MTHDIGIAFGTTIETTIGSGDGDGPLIGTANPETLIGSGRAGHRHARWRGVAAVDRLPESLGKPARGIFRAADAAIVRYRFRATACFRTGVDARDIVSPGARRP